MSKAELKLKIIQMVGSLEEETLLREVYKLLDSGNTFPNDDWWAQLSEDQKKGLQEGIDALDRGDHLTYEEVRKGIKEKFNI